MDIKELFSGVGIIIDDQIFNDDGHDKIRDIANSLESENIPLLKYDDLPEDDLLPNLSSVGFIILDWDLHQEIQVGEEYERGVVDFTKGIFEKTASPVFIFSNKDETELKEKLTKYKILRGAQQNPIFIRNKSKLNGDAKSIFSAIDEWLRSSPSVYLLKYWSKSFNDARVKLFREFYKASRNWPRILWKNEIDDIYGDGYNGEVSEVNELVASSELASIISKNIEAHMLPIKFDKKYILGDNSEPTTKEINDIMVAQRFIKDKGSSSMTGDFYQIDGEYYINIRPGCDCVSRDANDGYTYLLKGEHITSKKLFNTQYGKFTEQENHAIVGPIYKGWFFKFNFKHLTLRNFDEIKVKRIGRVLPPYITHITEKYGLYIQRQALPRIPSKIVENFRDDAISLDEIQIYTAEIARLKTKIKELEKKEVKEISCKFRGNIKTKGRI